MYRTNDGMAGTNAEPSTFLSRSKSPELSDTNLTLLALMTDTTDIVPDIQPFASSQLVQPSFPSVSALAGVQPSHLHRSLEHFSLQVQRSVQIT